MMSIDEIKTDLINSVFHSFRNANQFLELEFSSNDYEEIIFFMDCELSCSDESIRAITKSLDEFDSNIVDVTYFVPANNQGVKDVKYKDSFLELKFNNNYSLFFMLEEEYDEPLSISFKIKKGDENYKAFCLGKEDITKIEIGSSDDTNIVH